jgi:hypothetical protein
MGESGAEEEEDGSNDGDEVENGKRLGGSQW